MALAIDYMLHNKVSEGKAWALAKLTRRGSHQHGLNGQKRKEQ